MRDDIILKLQRIIEGNDRITWDLFPEIYNGFLEADELSLAEDRMLQLVASAVQTCIDDKLVATSSSDKIAEYENELGLSGEGLTLDERRQQVADYINRSRVINEYTLHSLVQSKAVGYTVYEKTDPQELTLGIFSEEDDDQGALISVGIVDEIRPVIPQNLELYAGVESSIDMPLAINHAHFSALCVSLGVLEWSPVPPPPPPPPEPAYSFIVFDTSTGTIVHSIVDDGMIYGEVGYVLMDESAQMITVYETGVRTESFYFTANGRNETQNTDISHADIPVYLEDGTAPAADTPYDGSSVLAFVDVEGNTKQADGESLYLDDGVLRLDAPDTDEGEQWAALVEYIEPEPPVPPLPTVERTDGWATTGSNAEYCNVRRSVPLYDNNRNRIQYDSTKSYVVTIGNGSGTSWRIEFFCASDSSGYLVAWNRTNVDLLVLGASVYSCSSNLAYRVIVSDSSDVKRPAFAYDLDGTTYYYVCDGVQTDWTDDLSAIGYSLVTGSEAYLTSLGASETVNTSVGNSSYYLYSSSGAYLYGNQSKKYVLIGQFLKDGTNITNNGMDSRLTTGMTCSAVSVSSDVSSWNKLRLNVNVYSYDVFKVTYLEV